LVEPQDLIGGGLNLFLERTEIVLIECASAMSQQGVGLVAAAIKAIDLSAGH
jgi:hypothetical protein